MSDGRGLGKGIRSIIICFIMMEYLMIKLIYVNGEGGMMRRLLTIYIINRKMTNIIIIMLLTIKIIILLNL